MKFSVLIPTRERLELLRHAVESVRLQDYADWEVVISDNASSQDVAGYVASLGEPRVRYSRTETLLPVTDNWNRALEQSSGDYLIMLGDDDALLPRCLSAAQRLLEEWRDPDLIYTQALQFAYPGVVPGEPEGFVQAGYSEIFPDGAAGPFLLPAQAAEALVRQAMAFRIRYGFNAQHFIFSHRLVEALRSKGAFFQSPYPDYYAANAMLLAARSIVAHPRPLVLIGISPRSFGFYHHNRREGEGVAFLQNFPSAGMRARLDATWVPGSNMNDSWLCAMETLAMNFAERSGLRVNYRRYRLLQYQATLRERSWRGIGVVLRHARWWEFFFYLPAVAAYALAFLLPGRARTRAQGSIKAALSAYPRFDLQRRTVPYRDILEAARGVSS
jgi:glycosyltransferase involved in cell wall biosynthesis